MDRTEQQEVKKNKAVRGYIIRALVKGYNNSLLVRQISNMLIDSGLLYTPDIGKYLDYLEDAGYVEFTDRRINAFNSYAEDAVLHLTREGVDLVEGTTDDPGVDI